MRTPTERTTPTNMISALPPYTWFPAAPTPLTRTSWRPPRAVVTSSSRPGSSSLVGTAMRVVTSTMHGWVAALRNLHPPLFLVRAVSVREPHHHRQPRSIPAALHLRGRPTGTTNGHIGPKESVAASTSIGYGAVAWSGASKAAARRTTSLGPVLPTSRGGLPSEPPPPPPLASACLQAPSLPRGVPCPLSPLDGAGAGRLELENRIPLEHHCRTW